MERQFVATMYVVRDGKVLLIYHRKLNKWLPPGGHMDQNETPPEAAKREVLEETGYEVEIIRQENIWISRWNANSFERPYMCLIEEIPPHKDQPAHQHIDFIYLGRIIGGIETHNNDETADLKWFSLDEINQLTPDDQIFLETQDVIRTFLVS